MSPTNEIDEVVQEFLVECHENLDQLDRDLIELEESPNDHDRLSSIFRTIHTIKGTCGFLGFPILEHITHRGESLLVNLRDGELRLDGDITNGLLAMLDAIRTILSNIASDKTEGINRYETLIEKLERLRLGTPLTSDISKTPSIGSRFCAPPSINLISDNEHVITDVGSIERAIAGLTDSAAHREIDAKSSTASDPPLEKNAQSESASSPAAASDSESAFCDKSQLVAETTVRLDVQLLDRLMNLVGELVLARNQIMQISHATQNVALIAASQRLSHITTELQEGVMKTRMQPIRNAWNKLPRVVRDLSQSCGKKVNVEMEGTDTELDKTILEAIKDPLTHIVRNSVDHGVETPEVRTALGKPAEGTLLLRAFHEGGKVNIEISDDGAGIHLDRVREKAIEKGLITTEQAAEMTECDIMNLILLPGFSTAAAVTNVSGRGVGMDVVKTNVERIGGTLDISSVQGKGTTLRIKIPLTLAIVPALVVTCGEVRYYIPQVNLHELVRLERGRARTEIGLLHSVPVFRLRGQLIPIIFLDEELGLRPRRTEAERQQADIVSIVVLQAEDRQFGLVVDRIADTQEIVVKPLGRHLKKIGLYAGSTIMGDGEVSLILDVIGLARQGRVLAERSTHKTQDQGRGRRDRSLSRDSYLIVESANGSRSAIQLSTVSRLENFRTDQIERHDDQAMVQYRGEIMPLVSVNGNCEMTSGERNTIPAVVFVDNNRQVGALVGKVVDIVEHDLGTGTNPQPNSPQILAGRITQIIDLKSLVSDFQY